MGDRIGPILLVFMFFGFCGPLGVLAFIGLVLVWAAYRILKAFVNLFRRPGRVKLGPRCPDCQTSMRPVTCMTCGPTRVPDFLPVAWA